MPVLLQNSDKRKIHLFTKTNVAECLHPLQVQMFLLSFPQVRSGPLLKGKKGWNSTWFFISSSWLL